MRYFIIRNGLHIATLPDSTQPAEIRIRVAQLRESPDDQFQILRGEKLPMREVTQCPN